MKIKTIGFVLKRWIKNEGYKGLTYGILGLVFKVINAIFGLALASLVIQVLMAGHSFHHTLRLIMGLLVLYGLSMTLGFYCYSRFSNLTMVYRIGELPSLFSKLIKLPFSEVEGASGKRAFEKAQGATGGGSNSGVEGVIKNLFNMTTDLICLLIFALLSAKLSLWIMVVLLLSGLARTHRDKKNRQWLDQNLDKIKEVHYERAYVRRKCLDTTIGKDVRLYQMESWFSQKFAHLFNRYKTLRHKKTRNDFLAETLQGLAGMVRDFICYGYLIYRMAQGMAISDFVLYFNLIAGFNLWIQKIFAELAQFRENILLVDYYKAYLAKDQIDQVNKMGQLEESKTYTYTFDHVYYAYRGEDYVIEDLNLVIHKGEKVALVGENGAGKSTLVKLMCGFYQPSHGRILINGVDLRDISSKDLLRITGVVFQDIKVFPDTIGDNITCCPRDQRDQVRLTKCLKASGLYDFVNYLPLGPDTILTKNMDESGVDLSGGQYQKLMLARALYKNAPVLILDEPTAALDPLAEEAMYNHYLEFTEGKTSLFISHRLSSTQFCDRVLFLKEGQVVQDGSHKQLMKEEGPYKTMFQAQAYYYQEEVAQ